MIEKSPKYLLDITSDGFRFQVDEDLHADYFLLSVDRMPIRGRCSGPHAELLGELSETLSVLENLHRNLPSISESVVVLGCEEDPFQAGISAFSDVLQLLQAFGKHSPKRIILQSSSSLVLPLLPILRAFRVELHVPFSCLCDRSSRHFGNECSRPSERLNLLASLNRAEIPVRAIVSPVLERQVRQSQLRRFAHSLARTGAEILLPRLLVDSGVRPSQALPAHNSYRLLEEIFSSEGIPFRNSLVKEMEDCMKEAA